MLNRVEDMEMQVTKELEQDAEEEQTRARVSSGYDRLNVKVDLLAENPGRPSNVIVTARFTRLNFFPLVTIQLLHPTYNFANFYFLIVGFVQMIPSVSLTDGTPSIWTTLIFIGALEMTIAAIENSARRRADKEMNRQAVGIIRRDASGAVVETKGTWAEVRVGDVVRVQSREAFPSDLLLLRGSDPPGQCWVNTKPLDGESDLKLRLVRGS